jgi:hypothetical protein
LRGFLFRLASRYLLRAGACSALEWAFMIVPGAYCAPYPAYASQWIAQRNLSGERRAIVASRCPSAHFGAETGDADGMRQAAKRSHFHAAMAVGPPEWRAASRGVIMSFVRQRGAESDRPGGEVESNIRELVRRDATALRQAESDSELAANNLSTLLRRVSAHSTREIDLLITELRTLRDKLHSDGNRVEREIVDYAALSQSVIQLTKIIADGVTQIKKVPDAPSITE